MIYSNSFEGQLGNQIIVYNNLVQISNILNTDFSFANWSNMKYFKINKNKVINKYDKKSYLLNSRDIIDINNSKKQINKEQLIEISILHNIKLESPCLGELFFQYNYTNPNNILKLEDKYIINMDTNFLYIGLHIRNMPGDWSKKHKNLNKLPSKYYIDSINYCLNKLNDNKNNKEIKFILFGAFNNNQFTNNEKANVLYDQTYLDIKQYMIENNITYEHCITYNNPEFSYIYDFSQMMDCDVLISAISTFSICAGFLGKQKKIIHAKQWVDYACSQNDTFWNDFRDSTLDFYKPWTII
jgi:hypothetical protein